MAAALVLACGLGLTGAAGAANSGDPDWPCVQRKVASLAVGLMWAGPAIAPEDLETWRRDPGVAALAPVLAVRRTTEAEAEKLIADFAAQSGDARDRKLALLFAGAFSLIDRERSEIISGIGRYARAQFAMASGIDEAQVQLSELLAIEAPDFDTQDRIEVMEDEILWKTRIYQDRQQSLTYVCETPVLLEKRAFWLARTIAGHAE
ncbi:MAG: hypothetical protein AAF409_13930 [Pseudomonadota bacterium]